MFIAKTDVEICAQRFGHFLSEECSYRLPRNQKNDLAHQKPECNRVIARLCFWLPKRFLLGQFSYDQVPVLRRLHRQHITH